MDPADVLDAAAEVIERDGWCQHKFMEEDGRVCLLGAIHRAESGCSREQHRRQIEDQKTCFTKRGDLVREIAYSHIGGAQWNDRSNRTEFEVIDALRHTAKAIRNGEIEVD